MMQPLKEFCSNNWRTRLGFLLSVVILMLASWAFSAQVGLPSDSIAFYALLLIAIGALYVIWLEQSSIQKHPRGEIGFDLLLDCYDEDNAERISQDFSEKLQLLIGSSNRFSFILHPQWLAKRGVGIDAARSVVNQSRGVFILFGTAKVRPIDNVPTNVIELHVLVRHEPLEAEISKRFSVEIGKLFNGNLVFKLDSDIFRFAQTADAHDKVARYIVGSAMALSGSFETSIEILEELEGKLKQVQDEGHGLKQVRKLLPLRLADTYSRQIDVLYDSFHFTRDHKYLVQIEQVLEKLEIISPNQYRTRVIRALCIFTLRRGVTEAKQQLLQCKGNTDTTWLYSLAFLYAYEGDLDTAWKYYRRAFRTPPRLGNVPVQTEEFIAEVIRDEPHRVHLHYCLGLINRNAKADIFSAKREFSEFLEKTPSSQYLFQRELAQKWIDEDL
jgi:tetratricopeptide (TPR) repeat protein